MKCGAQCSAATPLRQPGNGKSLGSGAYRDRFFGKLLCSFSRFGLQDAQTPPSPLVGEGGWGDEGQKRSLSRAFIDERSDAFGQPGYDLDPAPDSSASVWHRRNPAPQRSGSNPVIPHPGAPARLRVGVMSRSDDSAPSGFVLRLNDYEGAALAAKASPQRLRHPVSQGTMSPQPCAVD